MSRSKKSPTDPAPEDPKEASKWMYMVIEQFGYTTEAILGKGEAYGIIESLKRAEFRPDHRFTRLGPTKGQSGLLWHLGVPEGTAKCKRHASMLIDAIKEPREWYKKRAKEVEKARSERELDVLARDVALVKSYLPPDVLDAIIECGKARREELRGEPEGIPD